MRERCFAVLGRTLFSLLIGGALAWSLPAHAVSKAEANETAGNFVRLFLKSDDGAMRYASGDLDQWREVLERHAPGPGRFTGYGIIAIQGSSKSRRAIIRVERAEESEIFYLDFDGIGKITDFYTIVESLAASMDEMREVIRKICEIELTAESYAALEQLFVEQGRLANEIKALRWRHQQWVETD